MEISKIKALWKLATGGWSGLAVYVLEAVNKWLAKLDKTKLAQAAFVARAAANAIDALAALIPAKFASAVTSTTFAVSQLATALADGNVTQAELDANVEAVEAAVAAWKEVK